MTPHRPPPAPERPARRPVHVVPVGTLTVVATVLLSIVWLWMLVLGIQQGRAG
ncbi:hypothetical protein [Deinococcus multiflagellatus]|uniref:Uncharacterized protein n=1 Tax=Deinococcus multiflagellatus TaxID=1656887 RepID=A0ABW1ZS78_9DEIO